MKFALILLLFTTTCMAYRPIALVHGINNSSAQMELVVQWIEESLPGVYVRAFEIGDGRWDSVMMGMDEQLDILTREIQSDPYFQGAIDGFNVVGYSQGGVIARGYIEKVNSPHVHNFVTWSSPHAGIFGIPYVGIEWIDELVGRIPYDPWVQRSFSFAQYWNDPNIHQIYLNRSIYLADLNNEGETKNNTYHKNIASLNYFRCLWSDLDQTVSPQQSAIFSYYDYSDHKRLIPLRDRDLYTEDWIGLKILDDGDKLDLVGVSIPHPDYPNEVGKGIFDEYTLPLLDN